ncbi:MAG: outer membrane lipoprotein-sorting protein, partial [Silvanigrellaceae bacterium]|nr:outer membrane lipoprotein-sorting protein [Silvanigrellaceae bacterium]
VLELTFIPLLRSFMKPPSEKEVNREQENSIWDKIVKKLFYFATEKRKQVYIVTLALVALFSLGGFWLKVENSQKSYFYGKLQQKIDDDTLNERMAGTNVFYILIKGNEPDTIKRPDVLLAMENLQKHIEENSIVGKTVSLVNFIKKMNLSMHSDLKEFDVIPDSQELIAQYLLLYSSSGDPTDFDSYVDYSYQNALVTSFLKTDSSSQVTEIALSAKRYGDTIFPKDVKIEIGGGSLGGVALNEIMIREKLLNILQIMGAVFLVTSLVFQSLLAGILILVPLVSAVFVNFGIMGLLGIPLNISTALVSAMAVGIGADYGIYMSYRMREELRLKQSEQAALEKAFRSAGKATLFVSTAVAGGFGVLMLSWGFMIHLWMGFLIATAMLVSSYTALTLFPALILTLRPKFIFAERANQMKSKITSMLVIAFLVPVLGGIGSVFTAKAHGMSAVEIAKKNFSTSKVSDSTSDSTFRLINASGKERTRVTKGSTKLIPGTQDSQRLVIFESPADVKGTKTLLVEHSKGDDDMYIYLPALKKVRRLVASNKKESFVGTDFSYGDVIGHKVEDWHQKLLREEKIDGKDCYVIESTPVNPDVAKNSGYSKRISWIDKQSFVAIQGESYDLNQDLYKKYFARKVQKIDDKQDKWQPMEIEAQNVQTGHKTILEFTNFKANVGLSVDLFTLRTLEKQ